MPTPPRFGGLMVPLTPCGWGQRGFDSRHGHYFFSFTVLDIRRLRARGCEYYTMLDWVCSAAVDIMRECRSSSSNPRDQKTKECAKEEILQSLASETSSRGIGRVESVEETHTQRRLSPCYERIATSCGVLRPEVGKRMCSSTNKT